jgi:hypothetical protein
MGRDVHNRTCLPYLAMIRSMSVHPLWNGNKKGILGHDSAGRYAENHAELVIRKDVRSMYRYLGPNNSNGLLEMEYEPEAKSTSSIAQLTPLSQRMVIPESRVSGILNNPLKAGW